LTKILVISDTHVSTLQELSQALRQAVLEADWVVHCGDYTSIAVVQELQLLAARFVGVYGNADSSSVRSRLPNRATFEVQGKKIAVAHPHWGGHPAGLEEELLAQFPGAAAILYGHTHDRAISHINDTLLLNPGQGYRSFMVPASAGWLTIEHGGLRGETFTLDGP
jgi:hypothetical protein